LLSDLAGSRKRSVEVVFMNSQPRNDTDRVEIVNRAEELMLRSRRVARRMQERIWKTMGEESLAGPHVPPTPGVLLAEDDPLVRTLLEQTLLDEGFPTWSAADGLSALLLYHQNSDAIRVALLDVGMPTLDGPLTLRALREMAPEVLCCFITASTTDYSEEELYSLGADAVLHKPFAPDALVAVLRRLLGDRSVTPGQPALGEDG
jgi:CheY-like chemotaxis protein